MRKVLLYGELGDKYGKEFELEVRTLRQALSILSANFKDFKQHLIDSDSRLAGYEVWCGENNIEGKEEDFVQEGTGVIKIIPVVKGASAAARIVLGVVLVVVGVVLSAYGQAYGSPLVGIGWSLISGGVAQLLAKKPVTPDTTNDSTDTSSYIFSGDDNATRQGNPVPIGYGKFLVGSNVISQEITTGDIPV